MFRVPAGVVSGPVAWCCGSNLLAYKASGPNPLHWIFDVRDPRHKPILLDHTDRRSGRGLTRRSGDGGLIQPSLPRELSPTGTRVGFEDGKVGEGGHSSSLMVITTSPSFLYIFSSPPGEGDLSVNSKWILSNQLQMACDHGGIFYAPHPPVVLPDTLFNGGYHTLLNQ